MKSLKSFKGFTLVEMLVVMGILIILMTMGIAAGRFAISRANQIQHQNAADQLYQGLQSYYADNREFPQQSEFISWGNALSGTGVLAKYVDNSSFDGGSDATFYYGVDSVGQAVLVCTTFGGQDDTQGRGGYCNGNGFGVIPTGGSTQVSAKVMDGSTFNTLVRSNISATGFIATQWASNGGWE